jgi:hypothetical protein
VQGKHWIPVDMGGPTTNIPNTYGYWEECSPLDNLEYLEWQLAKKEKQNV